MAARAKKRSITDRALTAARCRSEMLVGPQADFSADHVRTGGVMEYLLRQKLAERSRPMTVRHPG